MLAETFGDEACGLVLKEKMAEDLEYTKQELLDRMLLALYDALFLRMSATWSNAANLPGVENVAHHHDIDLWQGIVEETSRGEVEPVRQAVLSDVGLEDGAHLGKVEAQTCQVGMSEGDLDGEVTLGGSRIDEGLVVRPRKLCGDRNVRATTDARHRGKELFELGRSGVEGVEERFTAARGSIIGLPRS